MKREHKSLTNKGFSLVELIIVVAIMAVLIGVLAPQYLRYVEKTRLQRDNTGISDFANVLKIAATEEKVNAEIGAAGTAGLTYTFDASATPPSLKAPASGATNLDGEVTLTVDLGDVTLTSNTYTKGAAGATPTLPEITVKVDSNGIVSVECSNFKETPNQATGTVKKF